MLHWAELIGSNLGSRATNVNIKLEQIDTSQNTEDLHYLSMSVAIMHDDLCDGIKKPPRNKVRHPSWTDVCIYIIDYQSSTVGEPSPRFKVV